MFLFCIFLRGVSFNIEPKDVLLIVGKDGKRSVFSLFFFCLMALFKEPTPIFKVLFGDFWLIKVWCSHGYVQIPSVYWWYKTSSHAAELTAGYYNPTNQNGYAPVFDVLKKYSATVKFVCSGMQISCQDNDALADPECLSWQVIASFLLRLWGVYPFGYC